MSRVYPVFCLMTAGTGFGLCEADFQVPPVHLIVNSKLKGAVRFIFRTYGKENTDNCQWHVSCQSVWNMTLYRLTAFIGGIGLL